MIVFLTVIVISPYLVRNIILVDTITITKSIGYNLWKGNNPSSTVEGNPNFGLSLREQINEVPKDKYYDINADKVFQEEGLKNIKNNPNTKSIIGILFPENNIPRPKMHIIIVVKENLM